MCWVFYIYAFSDLLPLVSHFLSNYPVFFISGILRLCDFFTWMYYILDVFIFPTFLGPFALATSWDIGAGFDGICIVFVENKYHLHFG